MALINLAQRTTPDPLQGRVFAATSLALFAPQPLAHTLGTAAIATIDYRVIYLATSLATLVTAVWSARRTQ